MGNKYKIKIMLLFVLIFVIIIFLIFSFIPCLRSIMLRINGADIWLKPPSKSKSYFESTVFGGESMFDIWEYRTDIKKIIKNKKFSKIEKNSLSTINTYISDFYNGAADINKKNFDELFDKNKIIKEGNYYFYKPFYHNYVNPDGIKEKEVYKFILLIADINSNKLYICTYDS